MKKDLIKLLITKADEIKDKNNSFIILTEALILWDFKSRVING